MFLARSTYWGPHSLEHPERDWHCRVKGYRDQRAHILDNLSRARRLQATDPRDKIYALLGVSTGLDLKDTRIAVDYDKDVIKVYTDFARYMLETTQSHELLSYLDRRCVKRFDESGHIFAVAEGIPPQLVTIPGIEDVIITGSISLSAPPNLLQFPHLPSWVPNWQRNDEYYSNHVTRTILSTLEPEAGDMSDRRKQIIRKNIFWLNRSQNLVMFGSTYGRVQQVGHRIDIQGREERAFESVRETYANDQDQKWREIMRLWDKKISSTTLDHYSPELMTQESTPSAAILNDQLFGYIESERFAYFDPLVNMSPHAIEALVERHLFDRAKKTVEWSNDETKAVDIVVDKNSVVDGKCIALFRNLSQYTGSFLEIGLPDFPNFDWPPGFDPALALLPPGAKRGDYIVHFKGFRVPFVVRDVALSTEGINAQEEREIRNKFDEKGDLRMLKIRIIGECVANGPSFDHFELPENKREKFLLEGNF